MLISAYVLSVFMQRETHICTDRKEDSLGVGGDGGIVRPLGTAWIFLRRGLTKLKINVRALAVPKRKLIFLVFSSITCHLSPLVWDLFCT